MQQASRNDSIHQGPSVRTALHDVLREGSRQLLPPAIAGEVAAYIQAHADLRYEHALRLVVRHGHCPESSRQTGLGDVPVSRPRVDDRRMDQNGERMHLGSRLQASHLRRSKSIADGLSRLHLESVSTRNSGETLAALLDTGTPGLPAKTGKRLAKFWRGDFAAWTQRRSWGERYAYLLADGIQFHVRLEEGCYGLIVAMGATAKSSGSGIACLTIVFKLTQAGRTQAATSQRPRSPRGLHPVPAPRGARQGHKVNPRIPSTGFASAPLSRRPPRHRSPVRIHPSLHMEPCCHNDTHL